SQHVTTRPPSATPPSFPSAQFDSGSGTSDVLETVCQQGLVEGLFPKIEGVENFFVLYDDPSRTSYKRYNWKAESPSESIWLVDPKREPTPLEDDEESLIVQSFKKSTWFPRLIVPAEVRDKLTK
ncbi:MAG: hypothetical protein K8F25_14175, partial [Fimbriimonadaceae bacterium]|nr:hypothetical protein [Alphaproteobacteria bacterium]